jgi:hypothetical protein
MVGYLLSIWQAFQCQFQRFGMFVCFDWLFSIHFGRLLAPLIAAGNTNVGSINVLLTSCFTSLDSAV